MICSISLPVPLSVVFRLAGRWRANGACWQVISVDCNPANEAAAVSCGADRYMSQPFAVHVLTPGHRQNWLCAQRCLCHVAAFRLAHKLLGDIARAWLTYASDIAGHWRAE